MEKELRFLKIDLSIQKILLVLSVLGILTLYLAAIPFVLLGFWQIVSGIYGALKLNSKVHKRYLAVVLPYVVGMFFGMETIIDYFFAGVFIFYLIIPFGFALWYFSISKKTIEELDVTAIYGEMDLEDILDSDEVLK